MRQDALFSWCKFRKDCKHTNKCDHNFAKQNNKNDETPNDYGGEKYGEQVTAIIVEEYLVIGIN